MTTAEAGPTLDFIQSTVTEDVKLGRGGGQVVTRFPPEPNGFLHIGHAKAICIDFGIAQMFGGTTNLRMDDTNPMKEEQKYIDAIQEDVRWLGFQWDRMCYASDYFGQIYEWARVLIRNGHAYVDDQSAEQIRQTRGTLTAPGTESPFRNRSVDENLDLLERMKNGEFPDGARVLRAKIDMAAPNIVMRDPVMYRILHQHHPRTGDAWCIYPMYDWAHGQSDWIEGVTHSLCDTSFEIHRPLYEWFVDRLAEAGAWPPGVRHKPRQIEFARGNITYMITSKRRLLELVEGGIVNGWDDPRMPTLRGMRRRGYLPESIVRFWKEAGVAKRVNNIHVSKLENILRDDLNRLAMRRLAVLDPLKVVITNFPADKVEWFDAVNNPEDESAGMRKVPFGREIYIEREDFMEDPPKKFFRLSPGVEVRLRYAYLATCTKVIKDGSGRVAELHCEIDPDSQGGKAPDGRKVKGTIHWVSAAHALDAQVRLYDSLFASEDPDDVAEGGNWLNNINPKSLTLVEHAKLEPALGEAKPGEPIQFERLGYFTPDASSAREALVFNRTVTLRDTWARMQGAPT
jgi:glutaminyl-tRNA synthetase